MYKILKFLNNSNYSNSALWINEAQFGFSHLRGPISSLDSNSDILEVGCGSGILLSMLAEEYSQHNFIGIEPFNEGFSSLRKLNTFVKKSGVNITIESYEKHQFKYDFIYCVNVFEHVNDWQHFLYWASNSLKKNGVFFVLCPNCGFPYESHFNIPIIFNKNFTLIIFKKYILTYEKKNKIHGLWNSLNFVKKSEIINFCQKNESELMFLLNDDLSIIDNMIERLSEDTFFKKRQYLIGKLAWLLKTIGILNFVKKFPNFLPYMKLSFTKTN